MGRLKRGWILPWVLPSQASALPSPRPQCDGAVKPGGIAVLLSPKPTNPLGLMETPLMFLELTV